jgi:hypothetical protein
VLEIEYQRATSSAGRLLDRVLEIKADMESGVIVPPITTDEAMALRVMREENGKWDRESTDKRREEWELEQRAGQQQADQRAGVTRRR